MEIRTYQNQNTLKFGSLLKASIKDILLSRYLAMQLTKRDIKAQYRQSYLGIFWALLTPMATACVWIFLNGTGTIALSETGIPYPVYAFTGTLIWSIIVEAINNPIINTNAARNILTKIDFPKEALIVSGIYKLLFNSSIKVVLLLLLVLVYGVSLSWTILLFPLAIVGAILFGTSIGLLITPLGLLYKDIGKLLSFGLPLIMYITPVVYNVPKEGVMRTIMEMNPFTPIVLVARELIGTGALEYLGFYFWVLGLSVPTLFIGLVIYRLSIPIIIERLSS